MEDVPGTPAPFPAGLVSVGLGFAALIAGWAAFFTLPQGWDPEPFFMTVAPLYAGLGLAWLTTGLMALRQGQPTHFWLGCIAALAPAAAAVILIIGGFTSIW